MISWINIPSRYVFLSSIVLIGNSLISVYCLNDDVDRFHPNIWLRMHYDLRDSVDDDCQRMLNAIEPGTFIPSHRHTNIVRMWSC